MEIGTKRLKLRNGKWGFYFLLLTSYFLLLTLFMPEAVMAGEMSERSRMMRMPKYSLWGDITLQYEDVNTGNMGTNRFAQNYRLNFRSYVLSPRLMYYTINTGWDIETGNMYSKRDAKTYGIETVFFPRSPFNFSLRALRTTGENYESSNYGLSMGYTRKVRPLRRREAPPPVEGEENVNRNTNDNLNTNTNLNANDEGDYEYNTNVNITQKPRPKAAEPWDKGLFSSIINTLPYSTYLNIDRTTSKYGDSESKWHSAALRFTGFLRKTSYSLGLDYHKWTSGGTSNKGNGAELNTRTPLKWSFFQKFENNIYYRKNDITTYNIFSRLRGKKGKQRYNIYAKYSSTSNGESAKQYSILADVQNAVPYTYKKVDLFYDAGIGFERLGNKNDFFAKGRLYTHKRLSLNTNVHSSLSVRGGTGYSEANFLGGISYTFRPRKGYALNIEFDPRKESLKTKTMKPQVRGWDYSIRTGYTFGISKTIRGRTGEGWGAGMPGVTGTNKTLISHRADLNINVYLRMLTLSSDAVFYYTDAGKSLSWNNSIYATVMRKIGVTIGTGLTVDMPEDGTKTTNYNIYNLITYRLSRNALLRLNSRYTKTMPAETTTLEIMPSLSWAWRRVFVDLEVRLKTDKTSSGAETKERRIMMRVTRPFNIL